LLGAATLAACGSADSPSPPAPTARLTVVVAVVDSLMPHEVGPATPRLAALKAAGTSYEQSRSVFIAETIPNHVAMMTGVYPARSGIFSNNYLEFGGAQPEELDLSAPEKLAANTLFTWIDRQCGGELSTAATLSKTYLFEVFSGDAVLNVPPDSHWDPRDSAAYIPSPSEHTPDVPTMDQALAQLPDADFHFINLGDVDRLAHASGEVPRAAALAEADAQVGRLVDALIAAGRWESTVLIVLSDHGMDYSAPGPLAAISTQGTLDALAACHEPMQAVASGGGELIYVVDRAATAGDRQAALRAARACLLGTQDCAALCPGATRPLNADGIEVAWYNAFDALDPDGSMPLSVVSSHAEAGDLMLAAGDGYKFAEPDPLGANGQIPGNHGHPVTLHNTMLVSGGSPWVRQGVAVAPSVAPPAVATTEWHLTRLPEQSETIDVAPTVAWLLGLEIADSDFPDYAERSLGFDGRVLTEAFTQFEAGASAPAPTRCGRY
jgi:hypothetical protein